jgi:hypothetical protein
MDEDSSDSPDFQDPPDVFVAHFLTCSSIWFDPQRSNPRFDLGGIFVHVEPPEGITFPFRLDRIFIYFQLWGEPGEYRVRVRLVLIHTTGSGEETEMQLGPWGEPREFPMPGQRSIVVTEIEYVQQVTFPISRVPFREPGVYEYQLWVDGIDEPIARERVLARSQL